MMPACTDRRERVEPAGVSAHPRFLVGIGVGGRVLVGLLVLAVNAGASPSFQGTAYLHFQDNEVVEVETCTAFLPERRGQLTGIRVSDTSTGRTSSMISWDNLQEVLVLESDDGSEGTWLRGDRVHVTLRNGQERELYLLSNIDKFGYECFDAFMESQRSGGTRASDVKRIVFGDDFGDARVNPETGRIWPRTYRFDPYTGQELEWIETEGQSFRIPEDQEIAVVRDYNFVHSELLVPGFSEAIPVDGEVSHRPVTEADQAHLRDAAVDYARTFVNPFSSGEDVSEKLEALRDAIDEN